MAVIRGWKFPIQVEDSTGKIKTVEDNENVRQSVKLILQTQKFERKVVPTFGTDMRNFMFEVVDPSFVSDLTRSVESSLKIWEEHIKDIHVSVRALPGPISEVQANIDYITDIEPSQERYAHNMNINNNG